MNERFCDRLVKAMNVRDIKPTELSQKASIDKGSISHYMNGDYKAKDVTLNKLAEALNVDEAWLMGYDVPMTKSNSNQLISDEILKFTLFGDDKETTDVQLENVKKYAQSLKKSSVIRNNLILSEHEEKVLVAYRSHPEMQEAVDRLLDVQKSEKVTVFAAARSADSSYTAGDKEISKSVIEKLNKAPVTDDDL